MGIHVFRDGTGEVPENAYICPQCGKRVDNYRCEQRLFNLQSWAGNCRPCKNVAPALPKLYATFYCKNCGCAWQWEDEGVDGRPDGE